MNFSFHPAGKRIVWKHRRRKPELKFELVYQYHSLASRHRFNTSKPFHWILFRFFKRPGEKTVIGFGPHSAPYIPDPYKQFYFPQAIILFKLWQRFNIFEII